MEEAENLRVGSALAEAWGLIGAVHERMPVLNREPRPEPEENRAMWGALMMRDGGKCWMCGRDDLFMVIDHLKPRSAFPPDQIHIADRSDNLAIACWDCNTDKSNRAVPFRARLGVVWYCPMDYPDYSPDEIGDEPMQVFCWNHKCAVAVPNDWGLARLG